ncbi:hypothetical protein [Bradyrhizobium japonicum]|uniref:Uncharacterized protein n=1 Tax=Bradyrhizobium japonicum TaxID=375 RepID=A0ABV2RL48_BRAJP|nr:hypothetical protein [Bradyrhizobium japonicum]MCP1793943.1 hypothetical protein [Bradyrhizobium japonicum]MCP1806376.1 hypothetical protein [Bradyrhizobium japonicum]MCP1815304.1 hypothetical protein [Bradyrhizobium japonicum]MCP1873179.1 hypothetical protein [Bradyrhizobium japonicum]
MRISLLTALMFATIVSLPVNAQQTTGQNLQNEADKGIKTQNSGASGLVGDQEKPGAAVHPPGQPGSTAANSTSAPSAQSSGTGMSGGPGNKNGPAAKGTVGASQHNPTVQQQDSSNIKGLPGGKSGPPAKQPSR